MLVTGSKGVSVIETWNRQVHILLVEDNPADVRLIREALKTTELQCVLETAADGEEALVRLFSEATNLLPPDLIILDLNLPRRSGHDVLSLIKGDPKTKGIPVIVLSSSGLAEDIEKAYGEYANCYIQKPENIDDLFRICSLLEAFWFEVAKLPKNPQVM